MKIMIVPMAAMAETHGPVSRCQVLAYGFKEAGFDVATCMAKDMNYREMDEIPNYYLDIPMPLGSPKAIATKVFSLAQKLRLSSKKAVRSFDEVLFLTGNLDYQYLKKSVASIRKAIHEFKPDKVYSEFNISAIIAAKKEGLPLYITVSFPTQFAFAHNLKLARGLNRLLNELALPVVEAPVKLFDWADKCFCMSIIELEPIEKTNVVYCGSLNSVTETPTPDKRDKILVYMGNGTVSAKRMLRVISDAFATSPYEVYIASAYLNKTDIANIHVASRWDFEQLLDEAVLFINHGGQNSIASGLIHGVPQIIIPGKIFERQFNAKCISENKAGVVMAYQNFKADYLGEVAERIIDSREFSENAAALGKKLFEAGGMNTLVQNF
jgi:UDP:flavonoid glycosyltransferase YjiC (YdhE family)